MLERKAVKGRNTGLYEIIVKNCIKVYKLINSRRTARSGWEHLSIQGH